MIKDIETRRTLFYRYKKMAEAIAKRMPLFDKYPDDIMQDAYMLLWKYTERVNLQKKNSPITYLYTCISKPLKQICATKYGNSRMKSWLLRDIGKFKNLFDQGYDTAESLSGVAGVKKNTANVVINYLSGVYSSSISNDELYDREDTNSELFVTDKSPELNLLNSSDYSTIKHLIEKHLPTQYKEVLYRSFGLEGYPKQTYKQISKDLMISVARVEQIKSLAFKRIKRLFDKLYDYEELFNDK